ncbi:hypothetical protein WICPIJ_007208 [Wickerhamomyces pijperi]|uniref:Uncharacterized protein n=1 Tax=Wickerhamomyces pijperi TaxID=599730 RepID=A0A9P8TJH0_WICPI|nr:hypothetical protein WICPIJ_007208 [Wickerhamomyces pijperi]
MDVFNDNRNGDTEKLGLDHNSLVDIVLQLLASGVGGTVRSEGEPPIHNDNIILRDIQGLDKINSWWFGTSGELVDPDGLHKCWNGFLFGENWVHLFGDDLGDGRLQVDPILVEESVQPVHGFSIVLDPLDTELSVHLVPHVETVLLDSGTVVNRSGKSDEENRCN